MATDRVKIALEALKELTRNGVFEDDLEKVRSLIEKVNLEEEHFLISETLENAEGLSLSESTINKLEGMKEDPEEEMG